MVVKGKVKRGIEDGTLEEKPNDMICLQKSKIRDRSGRFFFFFLFKLTISGKRFFLLARQDVFPSLDPKF